uniref:Protein FAR1-RELATED SEQUENCE n=1 Tax=Lactuca sativa TaxID=4236 RepID=A0A9R1WKA8_LACSA|nr:hypothetical protein LSAT_V11C200052790 [Lactuca sativa]
MLHIDYTCGTSLKNLRKRHILCFLIPIYIPIDVYNHPDFHLWSTMLDMFHLKENDWLRSVFKIRDLWIAAFMRDLELSGLMRTTSRSESLNYAFLHFLHHKSNLVKFMMSFDSAMEKKRHRQSFLPSSCPNTRYKVVFSRRSDSISITCNYMLFVQEGLLCRHMFFILNMKEYDEIPSNFILRRWGKDIIANGLLRKKYSYPHKGSKNECLIQDAYAILRLSINKIVNNEDELAKYITQLQEVDSGISLCTSPRASSSRSVHIEKIIRAAVPDSGSKTRDEPMVKESRALERKLCSLCHKPNHNARSCILRLKKSNLASETTKIRFDFCNDHSMSRNVEILMLILIFIVLDFISNNRIYFFFQIYCFWLKIFFYC